MKCYIEVSCRDLLCISQNLPTINLHTKNYFGGYISAKTIEDAVKLSVDKIADMAAAYGFKTVVDYECESVTVYSGNVQIAEYFNFTVVKCCADD